ncbi:MAG: LPS export ABC transporter permease LptG [Pseudohongiellaceae bacterium]
MGKIDRHIAITVMLAMLVVVALMSMVDLIFTLAEELADTDEDYTAARASLFVLQTMPSKIYELLPFTALGGALIGLGILASQNELTVIQASGVPTWRIVWSVMQPTLAVMLLSLMLGETIAPQLEQTAQSRKSVLQSGGQAINNAGGNWQKFGNEFVHINAIAPGGEELFGVTRYRLDENRQLVSSSFAESARYRRRGEASYWELSSVSETLIAPGEVNTRQHPQLDWPVDLSPELLSVLLVEPDRQSISGLYRFANFFESEGLEAGSYYLAFWKKLLQPLATAALVLLAVSFVFGPLRSVSAGFRVFIAICIGLGYTIVQKLMEPASLLYGFSPLIAVLLPILISLIIGATMLRRVR